MGSVHHSLPAFGLSEAGAFGLPAILNLALPGSINSPWNPRRRRSLISQHQSIRFLEQRKRLRVVQRHRRYRRLSLVEFVERTASLEFWLYQTRSNGSRYSKSDRNILDAKGRQSIQREIWRIQVSLPFGPGEFTYNTRRLSFRRCPTNTTSPLGDAKTVRNPFNSRKRPILMLLQNRQRAQEQAETIPTMSSGRWAFPI